MTKKPKTKLLKFVMSQAIKQRSEIDFKTIGNEF